MGGCGGGTESSLRQWNEDVVKVQLSGQEGDMRWKIPRKRA